MKLLALALFLGVLAGFEHSTAVVVNTVSDAGTSTDTVRYRLDPAKSTFMVHANRAGLTWYKGHSHRIVARDFSGEVAVDPGALNAASLRLAVRANSLEETDPVFTPQQKAIIKKELDDLVLESSKYPEITFTSTEVKGSIDRGALEVKIGGDLTLHGVTRHITIPARVTLEGDSIRAVGEFEINRKKYGVNATTAGRGLVRVRHTLKFKFDIIGTRV